jgi:hypothetical protein
MKISSPAVIIAVLTLRTVASQLELISIQIKLIVDVFKKYFIIITP